MSETLTEIARPQLRRRRMARERERRDVREAKPLAAVRGRRASTRRRTPRTRAPRSRPHARRSPPGPRFPPAQRAAFFGKAANALEARAEQIAQDMTAEMGKPLRESRLEALRAATILRYSAGEAWRPIGELYAPSVAEPAALHAAPAARRRRPHHAVELPDRDPRLEARTCAHLREHRRPQARLRGAADGPARRGGVRRGRPSAGSPERAHRLGIEGRRRARPEPGRAGDLVHRLGRGRAGRCATRRPRATAASSSSSAATTRWSSWPTRSSTARSRPPTRARSGRRARSARRRGGSSSRTSAYDAFRERLLARVAAGKVGDPADPEVEVGPVVNEDALEDILAAIERARDGRRRCSLAASGRTTTDT